MQSRPPHAVIRQALKKPFFVIISQIIHTHKRQYSRYTTSYFLASKLSLIFNTVFWKRKIVRYIDKRSYCFAGDFHFLNLVIKSDTPILIEHLMLWTSIIKQCSPLSFNNIVYMFVYILNFLLFFICFRDFRFASILVVCGIIVGVPDSVCYFLQRLARPGFDRFLFLLILRYKSV
jgi:hypothetical protein